MLKKFRINDIKQVENIIWMSLDRIFQMGLGIITNIFVTRYLGKDGTGVISYIKSFCSIFLSLSVVGVSNISIRFFVRERGKQGEILGTLLLIRLIGALFSTGIVILILPFLNVVDNIRSFIIMLNLVYYFNVFEVYRYWFNTMLKSKIATISSNIIYAFYALICIFFIDHHKSTDWFVLLYIAEMCFASFVMFLAYILCDVKVDSKIKASLTTFKKIIMDCWPLIIGTVSTTIYTRIDQLMIKGYMDNSAVGVYAVAVTLSELWYFVPQSIAVSILPRLSAEFADKEDSAWQTLVSRMTLLGYVAVIVVIIGAKFAVKLLYGKDFMDAVPIICIHVIAGIFVCQSQIRGDYFLVKNYTKSSLKANLMGALSNVAFNWVLIPLFGIYGAAIGTLMSYIVYGYLSSLIFPELRGFFKLQCKAFYLKNLLDTNY